MNTTLSIRDLTLEEYQQISGGNPALLPAVVAGLLTQIVIDGTRLVGQQIVDWYNNTSDTGRAVVEDQWQACANSPRCAQGKLEIQPDAGGDYDSYNF